MSDVLTLFKLRCIKKEMIYGLVNRADLILIRARFTRKQILILIQMKCE